MKEKRDHSEEGLGNVADVPESEFVGDDEDVFVISRVIVNYVVIALTFLLVGVAVGAVLFRPTTPPLDEAALSGIVREAVVAAIEAQIAGNMANAEPDELDTNTVYTVSAEDDPAIGPEDALVTIVEFSDFRCGFCGRFAKETLPQLIETYGDSIRFVYRDFPIFGDLSVRAAVAAECAHDQGAFWDYHNGLFDNASQISDGFFPQLAEQLELDLETFNTCLKDQAKYDEVFADQEAAQGIGPMGTPTFFVNGKPVIGAQPYPAFATAIDEALLALEEAESAG
jgi:protein-disulfide isomerase